MVMWYLDYEEAFFGRNGGRIRAADAVLVAAQISAVRLAPMHEMFMLVHTFHDDPSD